MAGKITLGAAVLAAALFVLQRRLVRSGIILLLVLTAAAVGGYELVHLHAVSCRRQRTASVSAGACMLNCSPLWWHSPLCSVRKRAVARALLRAFADTAEM